MPCYRFNQRILIVAGANGGCLLVSRKWTFVVLRLSPDDWVWSCLGTDIVKNRHFSTLSDILSCTYYSYVWLPRPHVLQMNDATKVEDYLFGVKIQPKLEIPVKDGFHGHDEEAKNLLVMTSLRMLCSSKQRRSWFYIGDKQLNNKS